MTPTIVATCAKGCHRKNADGEREAVRVTGGARLCKSCIDRLQDWLREIPERYALLPQYLLPTADLTKNPETKTTKSAHVPAPVRLPALDLLDTRRARKWLGLVPTDERRGALGVLHAIANEIRAAKNMTTPADPHTIGEASVISSNLAWLIAQYWVADTYDELRKLHYDLGAAVGQFPAKPIGACTNDVTPNTEGDEIPEPVTCGGPLLPSKTGVFCLHCSRSWGHLELRFLGRQLGEPA